MALQPFNDPLCETCLYSFFGSIRDRFRLAHDLRLWFDPCLIFRFRENFLINSNILLSFQNPVSGSDRRTSLLRFGPVCFQLRLRFCISPPHLHKVLRPTPRGLPGNTPGTVQRDPEVFLRSQQDPHSRGSPYLPDKMSLLHTGNRDRKRKGI